MKTEYTIKNFRVFGEDGARIEFAPLTILTGPNSSGKSSIVKSVLLLNSFMKGLKHEHELKWPMVLTDNKLDFSQYPSNLLGRYKDVFNHTSEGDEITFTYTIYSRMLGSEVNVELTFHPDKNDSLDNGHLKRIVVSRGDDTLYFSDKEDGSWVNFSEMKSAFIDFVKIQAFADNYLGLESANEFEGLPENEYKKQTKEFNTIRKSFDKKRFDDVVAYMRFVKINPIIGFDRIKDGFLDYMTKYGCVICIPVVDKLSGYPKEDAIDMLYEIIKKDDDPIERHILEQIITKYDFSGVEDFGAFYNKIESEWLEKICLDGVANILDAPCAPFLPSERCIKIFQQQFIIGQNQKNWESFDLFEDYNVGCSVSLTREFDGENNENLPFDLCYSILMRINELDGESINTKYYKLHCDRYDFLDGYEHFILNYVSHFIADAMSEVMLPAWSDTIGYVSTSRVDIKRMYDLQVDNDFTHLLKSYFENKRIYLNYLEEHKNQNSYARDYEPDSFMNSWVYKFGIGRAIKLEMDSDGAGVKIRLVKLDGTESLLANEGYGLTQLMSILLQIECAILSAKAVKINRAWNQHKLDGYKEDEFHYAEQTIAIEEPEIHLHPRFQSLLADMMVEAMRDYNIHFIVETHSEYLIRKLQLLTAKKKADAKNIAVYYLNEEVLPYNLGLKNNGEFTHNFGEGFFDEADNVAIELFKITSK